MNIEQLKSDLIAAGYTHVEINDDPVCGGVELTLLPGALRTAEGDWPAMAVLSRLDLIHEFVHEFPPELCIRGVKPDAEPVEVTDDIDPDGEYSA